MHETIMNASLADIFPKKERGKAYGFFIIFYGIDLFIGATFLEYLYDISVSLVI
jgi:hypothetical protein